MLRSILLFSSTPLFFQSLSFLLIFVLNAVSIPLLFHVCHIPRPSDPPLISYRNQDTRYLLLLYKTLDHWQNLPYFTANIVTYIRKILFLIDDSRSPFLSPDTNISVTSFSHMNCTLTKSYLCLAYSLAIVSANLAYSLVTLQVPNLR